MMKNPALSQVAIEAHSQLILKTMGTLMLTGCLDSPGQDASLHRKNLQRGRKLEPLWCGAIKGGVGFCIGA